jgi:hypothetical protein
MELVPSVVQSSGMGLMELVPSVVRSGGMGLVEWDLVELIKCIFKIGMGP